MIFNISKEELIEKKAYDTAKEINQQPVCWQKALKTVESNRIEIERFLKPLLEKTDLRVILTGAGTSAFAGEILAPYLSEKTAKRFEAIPTTDIVTHPASYFAEQIPTLLISFARSGCSPESVAAVDIANTILGDNCHHLIITCNKDGHLNKPSKGSLNSLTLLMPDESNDQSFAMTSSLTCMMVSCLSVFLPKKFNPISFDTVSVICQNSIEKFVPYINELIKRPFQRIIYLGSGGLKGVAQESSLKLLELTAGKLLVSFDSPTGFRHGPKSIVDETSLIVVFISNDPHARKYDLDLLTELRLNNKASMVIAVADQRDPMVEKGDHIYLSATLNGDDAVLSFPYLIFGQIYGFMRSLSLSISPNNPCPSGEVNRVVQGVKIYPFTAQ